MYVYIYTYIYVCMYVCILYGFLSIYGYSVTDRTGAAQDYRPPLVFAPLPIPWCIYLFPPDCDYMPVYVGTFGGRAR